MMTRITLWMSMINDGVGLTMDCAKASDTKSSLQSMKKGKDQCHFATAGIVRR